MFSLAAARAAPTHEDVELGGRGCGAAGSDLPAPRVAGVNLIEGASASVGPASRPADPEPGARGR
jgi:hypothetical protein